MKDTILGIIFNLAETMLIFTTGKLMHIKTNILLLIMTLFFICRCITNKSMHYKDWYRCLIWSLLVMTSLFLVGKLDVFSIIILTIYTAFISTEKADINNMYMWKGKNSKYQDIFDYVKYNSMNKDLIEFEENLKRKDNLLYIIYKYRFVDCLSYSEISDKIEMDTNRINDNIEKIALAIRIYCKI